MPFTPAPAFIEQSDFTFGWAPDGEDAHRGPAELSDVSNVLLDEATGALVTREGFTRAVASITSDSGRYVLSMGTIARANERYIIAVTTTGASGADNIKIYSIPLSTLTPTRIDTAGREWNNPKAQHWGMPIDGIWYGGTRGEPMYRYNPGNGNWNDDASVGDYKTWVSDTGDSVDTDNEYGRHYAFDGKERVFFQGDVFTPSRNIKFQSWEDDESYVRGDRVTRKTDGYRKSYRCIQQHTSDSSNRPDDGGQWKQYWKRVFLDRPRDEDGNTVDDWDFVPIAPKTNIAVWFADRLWLRADDQGEKSRLAFSAPVRPQKGEDIPDTVFDPKNFAPSSTVKGPGGGWIPFNDGKSDGPITALRVYGPYLVVFKRNQVWVLSGQSEQSFTTRRLYQGAGCVNMNAAVQHRGLLYFLSDHGLYVTDGTAVEQVPGSEKVRDWFTTRMDSAVADTAPYWPSMWSHGDFVWTSIPVDNGSPKHVTVAYHPETQSFWKTDLPVLDTVKFNIAGTETVFFSTPPDYGDDNIYKYGGNTDDDGTTGSGSHAKAITWSIETSWWPFGLARMQRRIRRTWALVRGAATYTLSGYSDYTKPGTAPMVNTTVVSATTPTYIEGKWFKDSHAVKFTLSAGAAPAVVHGIAVETEPRRSRYHSG